MENTTTKQCITCKQVLPLSKFRRYKNKSDFAYRRYCRECERKHSRERYYQKENQSNIEKKMECITCKQILSQSKFRRYKNRSGSIGYRRSCRECESKADSIRRQMRKSQMRKIQKSQMRKIQNDDTFRFMDFYKKYKVKGDEIRIV